MSDCISEYLAGHVCVPKWGFCLWLPVADTRVSSTVPERVSPGAWRTKPPELVLQGRAERVEVTGRRSSAGAAGRWQCQRLATWSGRMEAPRNSREPGGPRAETAGHILLEISPSCWGFLFCAGGSGPPPTRGSQREALRGLRRPPRLRPGPEGNLWAALPGTRREVCAGPGYFGHCSGSASSWPPPGPAPEAWEAALAPVSCLGK